LNSVEFRHRLVVAGVAAAPGGGNVLMGQLLVILGAIAMIVSLLADTASSRWVASNAITSLLLASMLASGIIHDSAKGYGFRARAGR